MKILLVTDLYPISDDEIKTPVVLFDFVREWKKSGIDVDVLKPNFLLNSFIRHKKFYRTGIFNDVYNVNYFTPFWGNVKNKIPNYNYDYDVIVAHMPSGIIFANKLQGKLICAVHNSDIEVLTNPLYRIYFKKQMEIGYKKSIGIACRSEVLKNKFLELYPQYENKVFLIPSGIDFKPLLREKNNRTKIVTCANLIKRKNIDKLIFAVNDMADMELTVIGSGKELTYLKKISNKNIKFTGYLNHEKVIDIFKQSDIFILPSVHETFGMVYLEAMASGCITVCTKNDGIDGIIKDNYNGFLIEPNTISIKSLIDKIRHTDDIEMKILLQNCYNTVKNYSLANCADIYLKNILEFM